jgi:ABC-2 type transport system ATP-binding protein
MNDMLPSTRSPSADRAPRPATMPPIITAEHVDRVFSEGVGVFDLTFTIPPGTIFGLIGPSGCGKTTTVRLLTGVYQPDRGQLTVMDRTPSTFSTHMRERIGYMPQHFVLYPTLTVWENLNFVASLYGMGYLSRRKRLREVLDFVELSDARHRLSSQLSGGMQRRLELACALAHSPSLIFADEPTAGIDPVLRGKFWEHFRQLRDQGRTLVVTTQYVGEAAYFDLIGVLRAGHLLYLETPENLRRKALGGEVIKLTVEPTQVRDALFLFQAHPEISDVRRSRSQPGLLYLTVDDAATMLPLILAIVGEQPALTVQQAAKYEPPFDDIFIQLMGQADDAHEAAAALLLASQGH